MVLENDTANWSLCRLREKSTLSLAVFLFSLSFQHFSFCSLLTQTLVLKRDFMPDWQIRGELPHWIIWLPHAQSQTHTHGHTDTQRFYYYTKFSWDKKHTLKQMPDFRFSQIYLLGTTKGRCLIYRMGSTFIVILGWKNNLWERTCVDKIPLLSCVNLHRSTDEAPILSLSS